MDGTDFAREVARADAEYARRLRLEKEQNRAGAVVLGLAVVLVAGLLASAAALYTQHIHLVVPALLVSVVAASFAVRTSVRAFVNVGG